MTRLRRGIPTSLLAVAALLAGATGGGLAPVERAAAATALPPTPDGLPAGIEDLARYVPADSCDAAAKPGTVAFADLLRSASGAASNISRGCGSDALSTSEHYDGRAVDWSVTVRSAASKATANAVIAWLLATDSAGHPYANARRLGVMYIIWDGRIWGSYRASDGWRPYSSCASLTSTAQDTTCHRNHAHISLSWEGAMKRTSWWTGSVARPEYGPCRVPDLNWAPPRTTPNHAPCLSYPRVAAPVGSTALMTRLTGYSGMYLAQGSSGPAVSTVQSRIGATPDGGFGPLTAAALRSWQVAARVPATGVTDAATWRALLATAPLGTPTPPPIPTPTPTPTRTPVPTPTRTPVPTPTRTPVPTPTRTPVPTPTRTPVPTPTRTPVPAPATPVGLDADGRPDLLTRRTDGSLWLYRGTTRGTVARPPRKVVAGWGGYRAVFSPGDLSGDGRADVLAVRRTGQLVLHAGTGTGRLVAPKVIGSGWTMFTEVLSPGDFNGDGRVDVIGRTPSGKLYLYAGNGHGGVTRGVRIGSGWKAFDTVLSTGDFSGDGRADLIARTPAGALVLYAGNGHGGFAGPGRVVSRGWQQFAAVAGVGDLTGDGRADLAGLRRGGRLLLYPGDGRGSFAAVGRVIATGLGSVDLVTGVR